MLGAIIGDIVGSTREFNALKTKDFALLEPGSQATDDGILTIAVGVAIRDGADLPTTLRRYTRDYPTSYGPTYWNWATQNWQGPYGSWANGAAMRVSACAWLARDLGHCLELADWSARVTHDHPEGIRGAQATALAAYLARDGFAPVDIRRIVSRISGYDLSRSVDEIRPGATFELKSWISVPEALTCALEATSFEDAIRNAVSLGADADTQAAIAGCVAEGLFGIPPDLERRALERLPAELRADLESLRPATVPSALLPGQIESIPAWDPELSLAWEREHYQYSTGDLDKLEEAGRNLRFEPEPAVGNEGIGARLLRIAGLR